MQTSTKLIIAGILIVLPIIIISAASNKAANAPAAHPGQPAHPPSSPGKCLGPSDANCDGVLSKQEWLAGAQINAERQFLTFDLNHDGVVTKEEVDTVKAQRFAHWQAMNKARMAKQAQKTGSVPGKPAPAKAPPPQ